MTDVIAEIAAERKRQIEEEGFTPEHDDRHQKGEIARAAAAYAWCAVLSQDVLEYGVEPRWDNRDLPKWTNFPILGQLWCWEWKWFKPKDRRHNLIRAAALIVAEIERLDRAAKKVGTT